MYEQEIQYTVRDYSYFHSARAHLKNKEGYYFYISISAGNDESAEFLLHETLDDLGFTGKRTEVN
jgi:hypothetical protein